MLGAWTVVFAIQDSTIVLNDSVRQYIDTIHPKDLVSTSSSDLLLLSLISEQSARLEARADSLQQIEDSLQRVEDSLALVIKQTIEPNALLLPLLLMPEQTRSLTDTTTSYDKFTLRRQARRYITTHRIDLYRGVLDTTILMKEELAVLTPSVGQLTPERALVKDSEEERQSLIRKIKNQYSPWRKELITMLQFTQNYVSQNWYAGGNSNFALLGVLQGTLNYDNKQNITWENNAEWRAGCNTVHGDSIRKLNCNEDLFKIYSKFGYKIYSNLYLSSSAEFKTQFFRTWKDNERTLKTGPFTPIRFNLAVGLDYKPVKGLSVVFAPVTYKLVYASDTTYVKSTTFGIESGSKLLNDIGSSLRVDWSWRPLREIALDSKFYFYTNYKKVEIDWEIVCNFIINRYLSARISLHPRYDNTVILENDEKAKLQFKEMLSIGFAHKFH